MTLEDRVEKLARAALLVLLAATLGWIGSARAQDRGSPQAEDEAPLILVARRELHDAFFGASVLLVKPAGNGQHLGFVINHPTDVTLGNLFPEHAPSQKVPDPVYLGGPLRTEYIFALVQSSASPGADALQIAGDLYVAVDARTVDHVIETDAAHARFFAGMVTWSAGELAEELKRGLWYVEDSDSDLVMRKATDGLWEELVTRSERRANTL